MEGVLGVAKAVPVPHTVEEDVSEERLEGEGWLVGEEDRVPGPSGVLDTLALPVMALILPVEVELPESED